ARLMEWIAERPKKDRGGAAVPGETLRQLEAVPWNLLRVEVDRRTLHVADVPARRSWKKDVAEQMFASAFSQLSLRGVPVAKDAAIRLDGKEATLKELHPGVNLSLKFAKDRPEITAVEATTPPR